MNWIWLILIILVVSFDIATSNILLSWLSIGFVVAWLSGFYLNFTYQVLIATVLGVIFIGIGSNISGKYIRNKIKNEPILVDKFVGKVYRADVDIQHETQHKINGIYWNLVNEGEPIHAGECFRVVGIKENKLSVVKEEKN